MLSMTGKPLNGKLCLTRIMLRSTNMQQQDWLRSTPTRSVISTRRPPERQTKQHKKQLVQHCRKPWKEPFHRWQPHRSGYQRSACGERVHQALTATTIEERLEQVCPQLQLEASKSRAPQPTQANPEKDHQSTGHCQSFGQADQPAIKHPAYPRRNKRVSCINRLYDQPHPGHASHTLWQRGDRSHCKNCGTQTQTDAQNRPILRIALQKTCNNQWITTDH